MWKYRKTNELYYSDINTNTKKNSELYHSDVYLGKDYSNGLKHWKYIKKEKKGDSWRYFYEVDNPFTEESTTREFEKTEDYGDNYGKYKSVDNTETKKPIDIDYKKTTKLFGGQHGATSYGSGSLSLTIQDGKLEREILPAIGRAFTNIGNSISKAVKNGQNFILKLFGRK